jgi:hypothetical protein
MSKLNHDGTTTRRHDEGQNNSAHTDEAGHDPSTSTNIEALSLKNHLVASFDVGPAEAGGHDWRHVITTDAMNTAGREYLGDVVAVVSS